MSICLSAKIYHDVKTKAECQASNTGKKVVVARTSLKTMSHESAKEIKAELIESRYQLQYSKSIDIQNELLAGLGVETRTEKALKSITKIPKTLLVYIRNLASNVALDTQTLRLQITAEATKRIKAYARPGYPTIAFYSVIQDSARSTITFICPVEDDILLLYDDGVEITCDDGTSLDYR